MRPVPTILHLDMDAFYASVEQEAKPSLRGRPVVVGGTGSRGVVATASYEARRFGIHSAMPVAQARRLCPNAAYLHPRFPLYRSISETVMELLRALSPLVEPLSLDEAFVDLAAGGVTTADEAHRTALRIRADIRESTALPASVGLAGSKMLAKIASEAAKPNGLLVLDPGTEEEYLAPLPARVLPGVGPATEAVLRRAGIVTAGEAVRAGRDELVQLLGQAHGAGLYQLARGIDHRPVVSERDAKSISVEDTFAEDLTDRVRIQLETDRLAVRCVARLRSAGRSGRTVVLKVRAADFTTVTRSETLRGPTDDPRVIREAAARLLGGVNTGTGVRLLGVGVSGLADYTQEDLFAQAAEVLRPPAGVPPEQPADGRATGAPAEPVTVPRWLPGGDVHHRRYGAGWAQGSGVGRVTVRFETPGSPPGRVRTFAVDDPELSPADPLPLRPVTYRGDAAEPPRADSAAAQVSALPPDATSSGGPAN